MKFIDDEEPFLVRTLTGRAIDKPGAALQYVLTDIEAINEHVGSLRERILSNFVRGVKTELDAEDAASRFWQQVRVLEDGLRSRLKNHSIPFWLQLSRRLAGIRDRTPVPDLLWIHTDRTIDLAISKFALNEVVESREIFHGIEFFKCDKDDVVAINEVFQLAQLLTSCSYCLRRVAFGGTVSVRDGHWVVDLGIRERLAEINTKRMKSYSSVFRHGGVPSNGMLPRPKGPWWFSIASTNSDESIWSGKAQEVVLWADEANGDGIVGPEEAYVPNYTFSDHDLTEAAEWLNLGAKALFTKRGFVPDSALAIIRAACELCREHLMTYKEGYFLRTFGYQVFDPETLLERAERVLEQQHLEVEREQLSAALTYLAYCDETKQRINLANRYPQRMLTKLADQRILVDYHHSSYAGMQLMEDFGNFQGVEGNLRGDSFVEFAIDGVLDAAPAAVVHAKNRRVVFADGAEREIDIAFALGAYLLLCECKARGQGYYDDIPSPSRLRNRWNKFVEELAKIDEIASRLILDPPANFGMPSQIKYVLACVVLPSVEWVDTLAEPYWLIDEEIPRICTVDEVALLAKLIIHGVRPLNARVMPVA